MGGPIEGGGHRKGGVTGLVAEQRTVIHARRMHDAMGVEHAGRVERLLHLLEGAHDAFAEHLGVEFAAHNAVAMLARVAALILAHDVERLLGHSAHGGDVGAVLHVQHRADMQAAHRGMRVPGALRAMPGEDVVQLFGEIGEIGQRDGAILDEGDRFAVALHRHHDVQPGFPHFGDLGLKARIGGPHDSARIAEIAHRLIQRGQLGQQWRILMAVEFHDQQRIRLAFDHAVDGGAEDRDGAAEIDHRAVHQFHRLRVELDQMLGGIHRRAEIRELADAEHFARLDGGELEFDARREGQRALTAHQNARQIAALQTVEIIAADAPQHVGEARCDLRRLARAEIAQQGDQRGGVGHVRPEAMPRSVGENGVDGLHVVGHQPVADGFRAAGIIRRHAANGAAAVGGGIDGEEQAVFFQRRVEMAEHNPRLHHRPPRLRIDGDKAAEMFGAVDHQGMIDRLPALAGAATACQHRNTGLSRDLQGGGDVFDPLRHDHAHRHGLIDGGIGGVAAPVGLGEQHLSANLPAQALGHGRLGDAGVKCHEIPPRRSGMR